MYLRLKKQRRSSGSQLCARNRDLSICRQFMGKGEKRIIGGANVRKRSDCQPKPHRPFMVHVRYNPDIDPLSPCLFEVSG